MMPRERLIGIGVFVVGALVLFAAGLFMIGDRRLMFGRDFDVHAEFAEVAGLQAGAAVRVGGMAAGEVTDIAIPRMPSERFRVRMRVREDLRPLVRADSVASIQTDGLVGNRFVRISPGSDGAPVVADGGTIRAEEPFDFADLLQRASRTVEEIGDIVTDLRGDIEQAITTINATAADAHALVETVRPDIEAIARAGRRISEDTSRITESVRAGRGTVGRLFNDDELYERATSIARNAEEVLREVRASVEDARAMIANVQHGIGAGQGPIRTIADDLRVTVASTRDTMSNLADMTEALKRSVLVRGYFEERGYYDLEALTAADYREGVLAGRHRQPIRVWLRADLLFEPVAAADTGSASGSADQSAGAAETLSAAGRLRLDRAMAEVLRYPRDTPLIVEGYATAETRDERFLRASDRADQVLEYIAAKYGLAASRMGTMPLVDESDRGPQDSAWDGIAIVVWVDRRALEPSPQD